MSAVVLVPVRESLDPGCDDALREVERRGTTVWRSRGSTAIDAARNQLATDALAAGFDELIWVDSDVVFEPDAVDALRRHGRPFVCGLYPKKGRREFACSFWPGTPPVGFGKAGGLTPVRYCGFGFVYAKRAVFAAVREKFDLPVLNQWFGKPLVPYFCPLWTGEGEHACYLAEDYAFCERARQCGFDLVADTTIRLWHVGTYRYGWEDAGSDKERFGSYTFHPAPPHPEPDRPDLPPPVPVPPPIVAPPPAATFPAPGPLRTEHAAPLPERFPRINLYVVSYPANADSLALTLKSLAASDWGADPVVLVQPADWPLGKASASRNYKRALDHAAADGCDFAVVLEDDVRVGRHFRHNLTANPLISRDACDYLGLFMPDLVAAPWERSEPALGYRLARPLYSGPNRLWEKHRVWGSQGYALSRRFVLATVERWELLREGQDSRVLSIASELKLPLWYTAPCLIDHAPVRSAFATPPARSADFAPDFRLEPSGFHPPDGVPGWLTVEEGRALWAAAEGRSVVELGTGCGRATVCLAQSAARVVTVDVEDQSAAAEWVRRFGGADKVVFRRGDLSACLAADVARYDLAFADTGQDEASVRRDLDIAVRALKTGGLVAVHDYPDPGWPDVRRVVDEYADRHKWQRVSQAGYLGVFRT